MPPARDEVVQGIAPGARNDTSREGKPPEAAQVARDTQDCVGPDEYALRRTRVRRFEPDDGVLVKELRVPGDYGGAECTLQGSEPEGPAPLVTQDELALLHCKGRIRHRTEGPYRA